MSEALTRQQITFLATSPARAVLYVITKTDGAVLRLTDHDHALTVGGNAYSPAGAPTSSAEDRTVGIAPDSRDLSGFLDSAAITDRDIRAGLYDGASVDVSVVSSDLPSVGAFSIGAYRVREIKRNGLVWEWVIEDRAALLSRNVGMTAKKICRHDFGDAGCSVNLAGNAPNGSGYTAVGTVSAVGTQRLRATFTGLVSSPADWYRHGRLVWATGSNAGLAFDIRLAVGGVLSLDRPTPEDIEVGDTASVIAGCDGRYSTCINRHENGRRFGGLHLIPGTRALIDRPEGRA